MQHPPQHYIGLARATLSDANLTPEQRAVFTDLTDALEHVAAHRDRLRAFQVEQVIEEKGRPKREAEERERQERAEAHRLRALEPLADRLAGVALDVAEASAGRVVIRAHLAEALHAALLRSGLAQDPRWPRPPPD
jgi:hypothetical protein